MQRTLIPELGKAPGSLDGDPGRGDNAAITNLEAANFPQRQLRGLGDGQGFVPKVQPVEKSVALPELFLQFLPKLQGTDVDTHGSKHRPAGELSWLRALQAAASLLLPSPEPLPSPSPHGRFGGKRQQEFRIAPCILL